VRATAARKHAIHKLAAARVSLSPPPSSSLSLSLPQPLCVDVTHVD